MIIRILKLLNDRPSTFLSYVRQTYLFFQTRVLWRFFIGDRSNILISNNVRFQSLRNVVVEEQAFFSIGKNSIVYENAKLEVLGNGKLLIGENSIVGDAKIVAREKISIGKNFLTSWNVYICDFDPHPVEAHERAKQINSMTLNFYPKFNQKDRVDLYQTEFKCSPIEIGDNNWIGANSTILKGAKIGNHCIIASGSVVLKGEYPDYSLIAGNPAKVVKKLS